ncbi:MAG: hypothetical protein MSS85_02880, partial [Pyramidobacter sp.]|nr:hypothetical protein [Pyramidobacter sp.]
MAVAHGVFPAWPFDIFCKDKSFFKKSPIMFLEERRFLYYFSIKRTNTRALRGSSERLNSLAAP